MFITCQECNTIFRLDESLLKPTGSKVRCSLCRHTFIAKPMPIQAVDQTNQITPAPVSSLVEDATPVDSSASSESFELEGIDLAELDSLLTDDDGLTEDDGGDFASEDIEADISSFESDLDDIDIDFDAALGNDDSQVAIPDAEAVSDEFDLEMNFDIDDDTIIVDEDMADLGIDSVVLEEEEDTAAGKNAAKGEPSLEDDLAMALGDIDLSFEDETRGGKTPAAETEKAQDNLDLENFDFELEEEGAAPVVDAQEGGVSFEDELELNLDDESIQEPLQDEPEASLEDDLELSLEDDALGGESEQAESSLNLEDDFDLSLDDEPAEAESEQAEPELSLENDFELSLEDEPAGEATETADTDLSFEDDFDLSLEEDTSTEPIEMAGEQEAELSLGADEIDEDIDIDDLDSLLESTDEKVVADADEADEGAFQMGDDLDLDLSMEPETAESDSSDAEDDFGELDFDLESDSDLDEAPPSTADAAVKGAAEVSMDEDEIDLSDIEEMLEGGDADLAETPAAPEPEASIDDDLGFGGAGEIDLAEIETAIDEADTIVDMDRDEVLEDQELSLAEERQVGDSAPSDVTADELDADDLDLDLSLESDAAEADDSDALDFDLDLDSETKEPDGDTVELEDVELDLADLDDSVEGKGKGVKEHVIESGDIELDFQIEEQAPVEESTATVATTSRTTKREIAIPDLGPEQTMETLAVAEKPRKGKVKAKARKPAKKKGGKLLGLFLFLLLLGAIAGGLYYAVFVMGIEIPYVSEYLKPSPKDTSGTINLSTLNINSKFVENSQAGRLFVITGKVRNGYNQERTRIELEGRLYVKGKKLVKKETSFAGVIISDQELAELSIAKIKQMLNTPPSPQESMGILRPGQNGPFMVVFDDLPPANQLDEFAIEPVSSTPGR